MAGIGQENRLTTEIRPWPPLEVLVKIETVPTVDWNKYAQVLGTKNT